MTLDILRFSILIFSRWGDKHLVELSDVLILWDVLIVAMATQLYSLVSPMTWVSAKQCMGRQFPPV